MHCRELTALLHQTIEVSVQQSRPGAPGALRSLYLAARPVEVYPVIHQILPRFAAGWRYSPLYHSVKYALSRPAGAVLLPAMPSCSNLQPFSARHLTHPSGTPRS